MRKYLSLILMLAVVGVVSSCEKEQLPNEVTPNDYTNNVTSSNSSAVDCELVGYWTVTYELEKYDDITTEGFYFWEDGTGYALSDSYRHDGSYLGLSRSGLKWSIEDNNLYLTYPDYDTLEMTYSIDGNKLTLVAEDESGKYEMALIRQHEADHRFMGDWSIMKKNGDKYVDQHIHFVTPTDCYTYSVEYSSPSAYPEVGNAHPVWYKYEFDNNTITMTGVMGGSSIKKDYKIEGTKLYLNGECYSNFKKENGL